MEYLPIVYIPNFNCFISSIDEPTKNSSLFTKIETNQGSRWIAFGKDPYFPPWDDTFQLNYFNPRTRKFMINILYQIANKCDGVRCDMAMLCLNDVITKTWGGYLFEERIEPPQTEFWNEAISYVKRVYPEFIFLAEVYWDLEWQLQQLGFDYTYDKRLYDRLERHSSKGIREHLLADLDYQRRSLRFVENHDERRAIETFGREKSMAAAVISGTVPGMCLYHQGQLEGDKIKIPVQLRRKTVEQQDEKIQQFYERLLMFTNRSNWQKAQWTLINVEEAWEGNNSWQNLLTWQWRTTDTKQLSIVTVNYASVRSQGRIYPILTGINKNKSLNFKDILSEKIFSRNIKEIVDQGLYIDLQPYQCHLFVVYGNHNQL